MEKNSMDELIIDGNSWQYFSTWLKKDMCKLWENYINVAKKYNLKKNKIIRGDGNIFDGFYYIKKGSIRLSSSDINGNEAILMYITEGNIFGESAFFNKIGVYVVFSAVEESEIYFFSNTVLKANNLLLNNDLQRNLLEYMSYKVGVLLHQQTEFLTDNEFGKVCRFLYNMGQYYDLKDEFPMKITQQEIAIFLGMHRGTLCKCLAKLKKDEVCKWCGTKKIQVLDYEKLLEYTENVFIL